MQIKRLALCADETGIEKRKGIASDLHVIAGAAKACDDIRSVNSLGRLPADARPNT